MAKKRERNPKRARRGRGEGSVFERPDGLWVGAASFGLNGSGKRIRRTVYGSTKAEVQSKLMQLRMESSAGHIPEAGVMSLAQLLDQWMRSSEGTISTRTLEERERLIRNHIRDAIGGVPVSKLNAVHISGFYADLRRRKVGATTIRSVADVLSIVLNYAVRLRIIPANPSKAVPKPKLPKRDMLVLDEEQVKVVLAAARESNQAALVSLALGTGARQGELLALTWPDVDLRKGTVAINKSLSQTKAGFIVKEPKTPSSRRVIKLPEFAVEALRAHRPAIAAGASAPVFCTRTGGYMDKKNVLRAFRGIVKAANLILPEGCREIPARLRFHDLRHTVASLLLSKGHSLKAVSQRLGHANPVMTLRVYATAMPGDDAKLADGLDGLLK